MHPGEFSPGHSAQIDHRATRYGARPFSATETLDVGADLGSTVSETYEAPHAFSGEIEKVTVELK
jgi:hypothetical protein